MINVPLAVDAREVLPRGTGFMVDTDGTLLGAGPGARLSVRPLSDRSVFDSRGQIYVTAP